MCIFRKCASNLQLILRKEECTDEYYLCHMCAINASVGAPMLSINNFLGNTNFLTWSRSSFLVNSLEDPVPPCSGLAMIIFTDRRCAYWEHSPCPKIRRDPRELNDLLNNERLWELNDGTVSP